MSKFIIHHKSQSSGRKQSIPGINATGYRYIIMLIALMMATTAMVPIMNAIPVHTPNIPGVPASTVNSPIISMNYSGPRSLIPYPASLTPISQDAGVYGGNVTVLLTMALSNQTALSSLLSSLSNPSSPRYHDYLSRSQFASRFSPSMGAYNEAVSYFNSFPGIHARTYSDRLSIQLNGPASEIGRSLNTSFAEISPGIYSAESSPSLPQAIGIHASFISGLTNRPLITSLNMKGNLHPSAPVAPHGSTASFPSPGTSGTAQVLYGSDLQVAYDEQSLLNITYPTNQVIATILWAGVNSTGAPVAPFNPSDIYSYYNATLPSYEPHPKVHGVPLNGAMKPGSSASTDATGANFENTLDLEMAGSTAPGSNIYNVYGPNSTTESIDSAFSFILNPNASYSALNNVSVITNSWGSQEYNNTAWYTDLQEAQARGITVLASSGDSGDNPSSQKYVGSNLQFPSAMAYNNFGVTAVGGTTLQLDQALHILSQKAWYESTNFTSGYPAGSDGGISSVFAEPSWQLNTEANNILQGQGRGGPDISAVANNTYIYESSNGTLYSYVIGGTSVSSPVVAGLIASINAVMNHYGKPDLGYLNPMIYSIANQQYRAYGYLPNTYYGVTGNYNYSLPAAAFSDVTQGRNHVYNAAFAYDLVTGWGSLDAYNYTIFNLNVNYTGSSFALQGVQDNLTIEALNVTSYYTNTSGGTDYVNTYFNASIQQNLFIANSMGAPLYFVQNVVYVNGSEQTGWAVNYTAWILFPFYGLYYNQVVFEYQFPLHGKILHFPHLFNVKTWLGDLGVLNGQVLNFQINSQILQIPVPGASYIIGSYNYAYHLQGKTYNNGPYPNAKYPGGLDPQMGLDGGQSLGIGVFRSPSAATLNASIEPLGYTHYIRPGTASYNESVDETGEVVYNINWVQGSNGNWSMSPSSAPLTNNPPYNNNSTQGVLSYMPLARDVQFRMTGLPSGTEWYVNLSTGQHFSSDTSYLNLSLTNGTYEAYLTNVSGYGVNPQEYTFTVNGNGFNLFAVYTPLLNQSRAAISRTLDLQSHHGYPGYVIPFANVSHISQSSDYVALDSADNVMFASIASDSAVEAFNASSGGYLGSISFGNSNLPENLLYDPLVNMLFVNVNNTQVDAINAGSYAFEYNITGLASGYNSFMMQLYGIGQDIVILSTTGTLSTFNVSNGAMEYNYTVTGSGYMTSNFTPYGDGFVVTGKTAYIANVSGQSIIVVNIPTGSVTSIATIGGFLPYGVMQYSPGNLLLSGFNSTEILNISGASVSAGPDTGGLVTADAIDQYTSTLYLVTVDVPSKLPYGTVSAINLTDNAVQNATNGLLKTTSIFFDGTNQVLYAGSGYGYAVYSLSVPTASVNHHYDVVFREIGLPSGTLWQLHFDGQILSNAATLGNNITDTVTGGNYTFTAANTPYYYTNTSLQELDVASSTVVTLLYLHYSYIEGTLSPDTGSLYINGVQVNLSTGAFNLTVTAGTYHIEATSPGYNTYYRNLTILPGNLTQLNITLQGVESVPPRTSPPPSGMTELLVIGGVSITLVVAGGLFAGLKRRR